jgi:vancomycin aglycone glucosyltransferase
MRVLLSAYGSPGSHGDAPPMVGLALQPRALQALGAEMLVCAPPNFAELLAGDGVSLVAGGMKLAMPAGGGWL